MFPSNFSNEDYDREIRTIHHIVETHVVQNSRVPGWAAESVAEQILSDNVDVNQETGTAIRREFRDCAEGITPLYVEVIYVQSKDL